ncbi:hypothetical protein KQI89_15395 [Clostridium sp. MSJ-4]|uniref:Uncharacterized protein n=1 Tax=Clostridium simiarum TaxID=2841506 RepID=A0ABS6F4E0_9CLOT|nr:hypothetical protein [Clostridium simiarum]
MRCLEVKVELTFEEYIFLHERKLSFMGICDKGISDIKRVITFIEVFTINKA